MDDKETTRALASSVSDAPVTSIMKPGEVYFNPEDPQRQRSYGDDDDVLGALGYKAEFKREFSLLTTFSVSFAVLGLLPSFATTLFYGMGYAGTAGRRANALQGAIQLLNTI